MSTPRKKKQWRITVEFRPKHKSQTTAKVFEGDIDMTTYAGALIVRLKKSTYGEWHWLAAYAAGSWVSAECEEITG